MIIATDWIEIKRKIEQACPECQQPVGHDMSCEWDQGGSE